MRGGEEHSFYGPLSSATEASVSFRLRAGLARFRPRTRALRIECGSPVDAAAHQRSLAEAEALLAAALVAAAAAAAAAAAG